MECYDVLEKGTNMSFGKNFVHLILFIGNITKYRFHETYKFDNKQV